MTFELNERGDVVFETVGNYTAIKSIDGLEINRQDVRNLTRLQLNSYYYIPNVGVDWLNVNSYSISEITDQLAATIEPYGAINISYNYSQNKEDEISISYYIQ